MKKHNFGAIHIDGRSPTPTASSWEQLPRFPWNILPLFSVMCDTALVEELGPKQACGDGFKEQHPPQPQDSSGSPRKSVSLFLWVG